MPRAGQRNVQRYSLEFKLKAGELSQLPDVEVCAAPRAAKKTHPVHRRTKAAIFACIAHGLTQLPAPNVGAFGPDRVTERGKYLNVWKQMNGRWKIKANMWNTDVPLPPPK